MNTDLKFYPSGDRAVLVQLGDGISEEVNDRVRSLYRAVIQARLPQITEAVPAYSSVLVHFRPELADLEEIKGVIRGLAASAGGENADEPRILVVPVCYGLHFGPDIWEMEDVLELSRQEIIDIHSGRDYRIYMMGFLPGFVYLGGMDERITFQRLRKPRLAIAAGAVGIAGSQTGIYPSQSPGGWRIIGNTPIRLFDPSKTEPTPVSAGDYIRFRPISVGEWYDIRRLVNEGRYEPEIIGGECAAGILEKPVGQGCGQRSAESIRREPPEASCAGESACLHDTHHSRFALRVISPGLLTTVQDMGRSGSQASGMTESGAMDRLSLGQANLLAGNAENAAALEMNYLGGKYRIEGNGRIALAGADMMPRLNGKPVKNNVPLDVQDGDVLELGPAVRGVRCYLAVAGGIDVPVVLGSRSTNLKAGIGGFEGRKLKAGDRLKACVSGAGGSEPGQEQPGVLDILSSRTDADGITEIRVIFGPQDFMFSPEAKETFTQSVYTVTNSSDRMGYRLDGPAVQAENGTDIISDGICFGSVQIPGSGQPIIMMADHQTSGGYAKIATVISSDLPLLAQLGPGSRIRFAEVR